MADRLKDKVAIVTGGASGFGAGIARAFAAEGARVLIADIEAARGEAVAGSLPGASHRAAFVQVDVSRPEQVEAMVRRGLELFSRVDVMVANAGLGQRPTALEETGDDELERLLAVNVKSVVYTARSIIPVFRRQGSGNLIVTASGIVLRPRPRLAVYSATKGAVLTLAKALALELAPDGIRVNALCPAAGDTPMLAEFMGGEVTEEATRQYMASMPLGRLIRPEDVGHAAVFLASDTEAGTLTGLALPVDSGRCT